MSSYIRSTVTYSDYKEIESSFFRAFMDKLASPSNNVKELLAKYDWLLENTFPIW